MTVSGDGGLLEVRVGSATGNVLASEKIDKSSNKVEDFRVLQGPKLFLLKLIRWVLRVRKPLCLFIVKRKHREQIKKHLIWQLQPMLQLFLSVPIKLQEEKNLTGSP